MSGFLLRLLVTNTDTVAQLKRVTMNQESTVPAVLTAVKSSGETQSLASRPVAAALLVCFVLWIVFLILKR